MEKILVHLCCGACGVIPVQSLKKAGYSVVGYFANSNIHPLSEYLRRREAARQAAEKMDVPVIWDDQSYDAQEWLANVHQKNIAHNPNNLRCFYCYEQRLTLTQRVAAKHNFKLFTTSLLYSKRQKHELIIEAGKAVEELGKTEEKTSPAFFYQDFRSMWKEGVDTSKEWGLFRQNYCGCIFSESERFQKELSSLSSQSQTTYTCP